MGFGMFTHSICDSDDQMHRTRDKSCDVTYSPQLCVLDASNRPVDEVDLLRTKNQLCEKIVT